MSLLGDPHSVTTDNIELNLPDHPSTRVEEQRAGLRQPGSLDRLQSMLVFQLQIADERLGESRTRVICGNRGNPPTETPERRSTSPLR
jgi:hypothetical protein